GIADAAFLEILAHAVAQLCRFAHVNNLAARVFVEINAGLLGQIFQLLSQGVGHTYILPCLERIWGSRLDLLSVFSAFKRSCSYGWERKTDSKRQALGFSRQIDLG